jgi:hypothetical protein
MFAGSQYIDTNGSGALGCGSISWDSLGNLTLSNVTITDTLYADSGYNLSVGSPLALTDGSSDTIVLNNSSGNGSFVGTISASGFAGQSLIIQDTGATKITLAQTGTITCSVVDSGEFKVANDADTYIDVKIDSNDKAVVVAKGRSNNEDISLWPTVSTSTLYSNINMGQLYTITLDDLKTMLDSSGSNQMSVYNNQMSKWALMVTRIGQ